MPKPARPALKKLLRDNLLASLDDALAAARTAEQQAPFNDRGALVWMLRRARARAARLYVEEQP